MQMPKLPNGTVSRKEQQGKYEKVRPGRVDVIDERGLHFRDTNHVYGAIAL
jgi:hypothetical protein